MKQFVFDELRPHDYNKLKTYLDENLSGEKMPGIYWIPIEKSILSDVQREHTDCMPHYFVAELIYTSLSLELLIRTQQKMKCTCMDYATKTQRDWVIEYFDAIFEKLEISV